MDLETVRAVAILSYLTSVISSYFSPIPPRVVKLPEIEDEGFLLKLVGFQFKALMELGIAIDHRRLAQYFPNQSAPSMFSEESILNIEDKIERLFVTMVGTYEHPQELVILRAQGLNIIKVKHVIGYNKTPTQTEILDQKHVHGLVSNPKKSISRVKMLELLREVIEKTCPREIVYWDDRLTNFIPSLEGKMVKITRPHWNHRMAHYSHQVALKFKLNKISPLPNSKHNHSRYEGLRERPITIGEFIRQNYGYECALVTAYELMHYYLARSETKIEI